MWSVWSKRVDVYLGRNMAMVRRQGGPTMLVEHPATWPFQRVLERVASAWQSSSGAAVPANGIATPKVGRSKVQLHITLGSSCCYAGTFVVPQGVQRYSELKSLAQAAFVRAVDAQAGVIAIDPMRPGLMASIGTRFFEDLNAWAGTHSASIASLVPLWSIATQCALARRKDIAALALSEPDGITLVVGPDRAQNSSRSTTISMIDPDIHDVQLPDQNMLTDKQVQLQLQRWKIANGLQDENLLTVVFDPTVTSQSQSQGLPKLWKTHWSCA